MMSEMKSAFRASKILSPSRRRSLLGHAPLGALLLGIASVMVRSAVSEPASDPSGERFQQRPGFVGCQLRTRGLVALALGPDAATALNAYIHAVG